MNSNALGHLNWFLWHSNFTVLILYCLIVFSSLLPLSGDTGRRSGRQLYELPTATLLSPISSLTRASLEDVPCLSKDRSKGWVTAIFISASIYILLILFFNPFQSDKDTPRTGNCKKLKSCYPHFKIYDFPASETWVMGLFDTCSYQSARGRQVQWEKENIWCKISS